MEKAEFVHLRNPFKKSTASVDSTQNQPQPFFMLVTSFRVLNNVFSIRLTFKDSFSYAVTYI